MRIASSVTRRIDVDDDRILMSGYVGPAPEPPPPAPWWSVLGTLVRQLAEDLRYRWECASRDAAHRRAFRRRQEDDDANGH